MKKFGIWLVILVIMLAAGGMMLASRLTVTRSGWQQKTADSKTKVLDLRKKAVEAQKLVDTARSDLQEASHGWGLPQSPLLQVGVGGGRPGVDVAQQVTKGGQLGVINVVLGTANSLQLNSVVYVFQPSPDGVGTSFVGPFKVGATQETQAALTSGWRLRPEDVEQWDKAWRYGPNWRIRLSIPRQHKTQFTDFEVIMLKKDEVLAEQQLHLQMQQNSKTKAELHLDLRMRELKGDPDQANQSLDIYLLQGYHKTVADLEDDRNKVQADVDALRRHIKRTRDEIERLNQENTQLAEEGSSDVPKAATSQKANSQN